MEDINRLKVGIDIGRNRIDLAMLRANGEIVEKHRAYANTQIGYEEAKAKLLKVLEEQGLEGVDLAVEATSYYWLPLFLTLQADKDLVEYDPRLTLLNAGWVKWFKKSRSPIHKSDQSDPYLIAEYLRTVPQISWWNIEERWLTLRFLTRRRMHVMKNLVREKNYYQLFLFLQYTSYNQVQPFASVFGKLSQKILNDEELYDELVKLSVPQLAARLEELHQKPLPEAQKIAAGLKQVYQERYRLVPTLAAPVRAVLESVASHIENLEDQIQKLNKTIQDTVKEGYPEIAWLRSIQGIGEVYSCGIAAEIAGIDRFLGGMKWDNHKNCLRKRNQRDAEDALAKMAGLWWPQNASGGFVAEERHMSKKGNAYLRFYIIEAAEHMRQCIPSYINYYQKKHDEVTKHAHKRALVLTGRKAIGLFVGLLHRKECYRPEVEISPTHSKKPPLPKISR